MSPASAEATVSVAASIQEVSREAADAILDRQARRYLGISGAEFVRRWNSGYWPHPDRVPGVILVSMLLSRPDAAA